MSLYALPGPLCFTPQQQEDQLRRVDKSKKNSTTGRSCTANLYQSDHPETFSSFAQVMSRRHDRTASSALSNQRVILDLSKMEPFANHCCSHGFRSEDGGSEMKRGLTTNSVFLHHDQYLRIEVKDTTINFLRLTRPEGTNINPTVLPRKKRFGSRLHRRQEYQKHQSNYNLGTRTLDRYETAVEFEFVISFAGRKYAAKRSLQEVVQLRKDLLEEMALEQEWAERQLRKEQTRTDESIMLDEHEEDLTVDSSGQPLTPSRSSSMDESDTTTFITSGSGSSVVKTRLPEIPRLSDDTTRGTFGGGFAQMTGMLHAYRPALQQWFQRVVDLVSDDSAILADFVWEPLSAKCMDEVHADLITLPSIQETA